VTTLYSSLLYTRYSSQSVTISSSRFLVTDFNSGVPPQLLCPHRCPLANTTELNFKFCPAYNISARTSGKHSSSILACMLLALPRNGRCLQSRCLATGLYATIHNKPCVCIYEWFSNIDNCFAVKALHKCIATVLVHCTQNDGVRSEVDVLISSSENYWYMTMNICMPYNLERQFLNGTWYYWKCIFLLQWRRHLVRSCLSVWQLFVLYFSLPKPFEGYWWKAIL
jgi:hypothetical protein